MRIFAGVSMPFLFQVTSRTIAMMAQTTEADPNTNSRRLAIQPPFKFRITPAHIAGIAVIKAANSHAHQW